MSTVLYSYRIKRSDLWPLAEALRERYLSVSPLARLLRDFMPRMDEQQQTDFRRRFFDQGNDYVRELASADLVLYEEDDDYFLLRFSEYGWFGYEQLDRDLSQWVADSGWTERVEQVIVDNRSDANLAGDKRNMPAADLVDQLVRKRHYLLVRLLEPSDLRSLSYELQPQTGLEPLDAKDLDELVSGHPPILPCIRCGSRELKAELENGFSIRCSSCGAERRRDGSLIEV